MEKYLHRIGGGYYYRRRYRDRTIKLSLNTDGYRQGYILSCFLNFSFEVLMVGKPLFEDLRRQLQGLRDKASSEARVMLLDFLISGSREADEALYPIVDKVDAERVIAYEARVLKAAGEAPVLDPDGPSMDHLIEQYLIVKRGEWRRPGVSEANFRRVWKLTGIVGVDGINKAAIGRFKKVLMGKYKGSSVKQNYQIAQAFVEWLCINTDVLEVNLFRVVNDLKGRTLGKKKPVDSGLWAEVMGAGGLTDVELEVCRFMYWTGANIREVLSIEVDDFVEVDGIGCVQIREGKNESRSVAIPLPEGLGAWEPVGVGKTVEAFTVLNRSLKRFGITSHSFRVGYADRLRGLGLATELIQRLMRHSVSTVLGQRSPQSKRHKSFIF